LDFWINILDVAGFGQAAPGTCAAKGREPSRLMPHIFLKKQIFSPKDQLALILYRYLCRTFGAHPYPIRISRPYGRAY
jgi:hypothetical protein